MCPPRSISPAPMLANTPPLPAPCSSCCSAVQLELAGAVGSLIVWVLAIVILVKSCSNGLPQLGRWAGSSAGVGTAGCLHGCWKVLSSSQTRAHPRPCLMLPPAPAACSTFPVVGFTSLGEPASCPADDITCLRLLGSLGLLQGRTPLIMVQMRQGSLYPCCLQALWRRPSPWRASPSICRPCSCPCEPPPLPAAAIAWYCMSLL